MLIGLVGKPNAGKSTFFKACTLASVAIAPYPFTTIEPNQGVGFVRVKCPEAVARKKCQPNHGYCIEGERFVPVKLIDVAGLVPEAHLGKGRGNEFLNDLSEADCLIHVLDISGKSDEHGNPTENYDVVKDVEFLEKEIDMWIKKILAKNWKSMEHKARQTGNISEGVALQLSGLKIKEEEVSEIIKRLDLEKNEWSDSDLYKFAREIRKKNKPIIIAANKADRKEAKENLEKLKNKFPDLLIVPCSAESELALREAAKDEIIDYIPGNREFKILNEARLNQKQKAALNFVEKNVLDIYGSTGIQKCLNEAVFSFLKFIAVYPVENEHHFCDSKGNILPDAFLLPQGSTALDLAFAIHTDIGKAFIGAIDCKTGKKIGKESKLKNGDIIKILTR